MKNFINICALLVLCYSAKTLSESIQPHVGSIQTPGIFGRRHSCGAGILNQRWLITSANCLKHFDQPEAFMIRTGMGIPDILHPRRYQDYIVEFTFSHPNYTHEENSEYDIALLKVNRPIQYDDTCLPIGLYSGNKDLEIGTTGTVAGWINADDSNNRGFRLRVVDLNIVAQEECQNSHNFDVTRNMMCVRSNKCHVDSGSPFIVNNEIVGISVGSIGCLHNKDLPATLTRINQEIKKWIENIIQ